MYYNAQAVVECNEKRRDSYTVNYNAARSTISCIIAKVQCIIRVEEKLCDIYRGGMQLLYYEDMQLYRREIIRTAVHHR